MRRGRLIAVEGGEAVGKSTQAARLAERLGAVLTREPGGTEFGEALRRLLLDPASGKLDDRAEALLLAAARAQHVAEIIGPALARGEDVVTDRYVASTLAYQGFGRGLPAGELNRLSEWATGGIHADLVVLLTLPAEIAGERMGGGLDRLEAAGDEFHGRVAAGYLALAERDPHRWVVVNGAGTADEVFDRLWAAVQGRLSRA